MLLLSARSGNRCPCITASHPFKRVSVHVVQTKFRGCERIRFITSELALKSEFDICFSLTWVPKSKISEGLPQSHVKDHIVFVFPFANCQTGPEILLVDLKPIIRSTYRNDFFPGYLKINRCG